MTVCLVLLDVSPSAAPCLRMDTLSEGGNLLGHVCVVRKQEAQDTKSVNCGIKFFPMCFAGM